MSESWDPGSSRYLGRPVLRFEDRRLVTGRGRFVADVVDEGTLTIGFVRSPVPHGTIQEIDLGGAPSLPGIAAIYTADDLDLPDIPGGPPDTERAAMGRPPLARERVRYVGEPVVAVVAEAAAAVADAINEIWLEIDEMPAITDPAGASAGPELFPGGNVVAHSATSQSGGAPADLPITVTIEVRNQRLAPTPIEGLAILCRPGRDRLEITCSHQAPHRFKTVMAQMLGLDPSRVRVVVPDVGGAFGLKGMLFPEYLVTAAAALRLQRPVVWVESRREHMTSGTHGRGQVHRMTLEGEPTGRIRRAHIEILADTGAYPHNGALLPELSRFMATGLYDIEDVTIEVTTVVTNRAPIGSYRGAGRPEAAYAIERAVDAFAREAELDPAVVRRTNFIAKEALPYTTVTRAVYDSGDYTAALDKALELVGVGDLRREQARRRRHGGKPLGIGIGAFAERAGGAADSGEFGDVEMLPSGRLVARTGSTSSGQGHATVFAQVVAEVFAVDPGLVDVVAGDTDAVAEGTGTFASRSAQVGASAAYRCALRVREMAAAAAAAVLDASPDELRVQDGRFIAEGGIGYSISFPEVVEYAASRGISLRAAENFVPGTQTFPYGTYVAVVEVDPETGVVDLLNLVAVDDCGPVLNPMIVAGQVEGALTQGMGQALLEGIEYSEDGIPLTTTLVDYRIPAASDVPRFETARISHPAPSNPLGVKGTGEAGCIGAPPAIVNAVLDALVPYGVDHLEMPLRPDRVWQAMQAAGSGEPRLTSSSWEAR